MQLATGRLEFAPPPTPGLVRALGLAVLAHLALLAALTWGVHWRREAVTLSVEAELWSALPQSAAPRLVEVPPEPPAPALPPPAQVEPKLPDPAIALEREKLRLEKLRVQAIDEQRQEKLHQEKLRLEKKRQQERQAAQEKVKAELEAKRQEAVAAQQELLRTEAQRLTNLKRLSGLAGASGTPGASGSARQSSGPSASYASRVSARIKPNIVFADSMEGNPLAEVEVRTAPTGTIISRRLTKSSGLRKWDDAVLKAIDKTSELPRDVDGTIPSTLIIGFTPKD